MNSRIDLVLRELVEPRLDTNGGFLNNVPALPSRDSTRVQRGAAANGGDRRRLSVRTAR
jgi:hypothetical protein